MHSKVLHSERYYLTTSLMFLLCLFLPKEAFHIIIWSSWLWYFPLTTAEFPLKDGLHLCVSVFNHHVSMCTTYLPGDQGSQKKGMDSPKTGVTYSCEPLCGFWEPNLHPFYKLQVLLSHLSSLSPNNFYVYW